MQLAQTEREIRENREAWEAADKALAVLRAGSGDAGSRPASRFTGNLIRFAKTGKPLFWRSGQRRLTAWP